LFISCGEDLQSVLVAPVVVNFKHRDCFKALQGLLNPKNELQALLLKKCHCWFWP